MRNVGVDAGTGAGGHAMPLDLPPGSGAIPGVESFGSDKEKVIDVVGSV